MRLPPFAIERYFAPREFTAEYMLCGSDCESMSIAELLEMVPGAADRLQQHGLGYTESAGSPGLRAAIADLYAKVSSDGVIVHNGAGEAIFTFMAAMLEPGDHVVVHYPCYQSLFQVAEWLGAQVSRWEVTEATGWALDPDDLAALLTDRTRAIIVNTPHNPTGWLMSEERMTRLVEVAERYGVVLLCDEVYRGLEHDPATTLPAAADLSPRAVSIGVMSKTYGLPGLRIGWTAAQDEAILRRILQVKDYTTLCNGGPSELLAELALSVGEQIISRNRDIVNANLTLLRAFFDRHAKRLHWVEPRAGAIGFPTLTDREPDSFCANVLDRTGVLLLPGSVYNSDSHQVRIGFGRRNMPEALARLDSYLS